MPATASRHANALLWWSLPSLSLIRGVRPVAQDHQHLLQQPLGLEVGEQGAHSLVQDPLQNLLPQMQPKGVDYARKASEECQDDVDDEVNADASGKESADRGQEYAAEQFDYTHRDVPCKAVTVDFIVL